MAYRVGGNAGEWFQGDSAGSDTYFTNGGNDTVYAGYGNDAIYAGNGNDFISAADGPGPLSWGNVGTYAPSAYYGADWASGEGGNDTLDYGTNLSSGGRLYGDFYYAGAAPAGSEPEGADNIYGGAGDETIWGGGNNDYLFGGAGDDFIHGDYGFTSRSGGVDYTIPIPGYDGNDVIIGGLGADHMSGDGGYNRFVINAGDSGLTQWTSDYIWDFNIYKDKLDLPIAGTYANTANLSNTGDWNDPGQNLNVAEYQMGHFGKTYVFIETDHSSEGVYGGTLYADLNGDHHADTAIRMEQVSWLPYYDIV